MTWSRKRPGRGYTYRATTASAEPLHITIDGRADRGYFPSAHFRVDLLMQLDKYDSPAAAATAIQTAAIRALRSTIERLQAQGLPPPHDDE